MIDYKLIERRLEDALNKETKESLLEWLKNHETQNQEDQRSVNVDQRVSPTEPTFTQKQILDLVRKELTEAFSDDYTPDELKDKIYLVHGYIIGALRR